MDSNHRPHDYESCALTAELRSLRSAIEFSLRGWPAEPLLIAVPNVSEGRDRAGARAARGVRGPGAGARRARRSRPQPRRVHARRAPGRAVGRAGRARPRRPSSTSTCARHDGVHPHVGRARRDAGRLARRASAAARPAPRRSRRPALVGEDVGLPVFLYGDLATRPEHVERAWLRRGGPAGLAERMESGELTPDYGPPRAHPTAGAVLATARRPLVAFNVDLATDDVELAKLDRRGAARGDGRPAGRARARPLPRRARPRAGVDQRARPPGGAARGDRRARARPRARWPRPS